MLLADVGLAELHTHLGGSVASDTMWSLAHEQGIALPVKDYWEFDRLVTVSDPRGVPDLNALDAIYHWTELIQSSPLAVERSVHAAIGGAYRSQGITTLELRFNPMKRNRGGERDLDHIILAAIRGLDRASLEYPQVRAGLILMMDRTFTSRQNEVIVEIKSVDQLARVHKKQLLTYLKLSGLCVGILVNFGGELLKGNIERLVVGKAPNLLSARISTEHR